MQFKKRLLASALFMSMAWGSADAALLRFDFTGVAINASASPGNVKPLAGHFSYDPDTAILESGDGNGAGVYAPGPQGHIAAEMNGHQFFAQLRRIYVINDEGGEWDDVVAFSGGPVYIDGVAGTASDIFSMRMFSKVGTEALSNSKLPVSYDVGAFDYLGVLGTLQTRQTGRLSLFIESITAVPEPSAIAMLLFGCAGVIAGKAAGRRRQAG